MSEELRSIPPQHGSFVFTSESVTEGHPDKIADQISDAVLDAILAKEIELQEQGYIAPNGVPANVENVRCACETLVTTGTVIVAGEIRTQAYVDVQEIARGVIRRIGYNRAKFGFDCDTCGVMSLIHEQSPDIAQGVDESFETQTGATTDPIDLIGAGDQGMMFGYASNETKTLMPMPHYLASRLAERLAAVRHDGTLPYLRPDGKTQVTVRYKEGRPVEVTTIVISTQHAAEIEDMGKIKADLIEHVIAPVMAAENMPWDNADIYVNPTGRFVVGGPMGDTGLTGRKIIVDTYGGSAPHGGGAFSGKDPTKVDRSAAYAARYVAKNIVAAGLAKRCLVQLAYAIGVAEPVSVFVDTQGTGTVPDAQIAAAVQQVFDLRPTAIIRDLELSRPIYRQLAAYGHMGREELGVRWEDTDRTDALRAAVAKTVKEFYHKDYDASDIRTSIIAAISVRVTDPVFESQTKIKLGSKEIEPGVPLRNFIVDFLAKHLDDYLHKHSETAQILQKKIVENEKERKAISGIQKKARETAKKVSLNNKKLRDCKIHLTDKNELAEESMIFITEGNSASGSITKSRDVRTQAVFSLRGKPLNCFGLTKKVVYEN